LSPPPTPLARTKIRFTTPATTSGICLSYSDPLPPGRSPERDPEEPRDPGPLGHLHCPVCLATLSAVLARGDAPSCAPLARPPGGLLHLRPHLLQRLPAPRPPARRPLPHLQGQVLPARGSVHPSSGSASWASTPSTCPALSWGRGEGSMAICYIFLLHICSDPSLFSMSGIFRWQCHYGIGIP
jgi:hypothetical protein